MKLTVDAAMLEDLYQDLLQRYPRDHFGSIVLKSQGYFDPVVEHDRVYFGETFGVPAVEDVLRFCITHLPLKYAWEVDQGTLHTVNYKYVQGSKRATEEALTLLAEAERLYDEFKQYWTETKHMVVFPRGWNNQAKLVTRDAGWWVEKNCADQLAGKYGAEIKAMYEPIRAQARVRQARGF